MIANSIANFYTLTSTAFFDHGSKLWIAVGTNLKLKEIKESFIKLSSFFFDSFLNRFDLEKFVDTKQKTNHWKYARDNPNYERSVHGPGEFQNP